MTVKFRVVSLFLLIALVATVGTAAAAPPDTRNFRAHVNGDGAGVESLGQGQAIFQFSTDGDELYYKLIVANIENVTMAHIHVAPQGQLNGPPVLWLYPDAPPPQLIEGRFDGVLAEGTVTADDLVGPLAGGSFDDLKMAIHEGRAYVNVHTTQHPGGEIRGTIH
jgi:hypothetical protein